MCSVCVVHILWDTSENFCFFLVYSTTPATARSPNTTATSATSTAVAVPAMTGIVMASVDGVPVTVHKLLYQVHDKLLLPLYIDNPMIAS